jgi:Protein of unknown function (DUF4058)
MPSPFPGMDPYLEKPSRWPGIHLNLIAATQALLTSQLRPKYLVRVEERVYIADDYDDPRKAKMRVPDVEVAVRPGWGQATFAPGGSEADALEVLEPIIATTWFDELEIHQAFLNVIDNETRDVITVIEILSPANKIPGSHGSESYEKKFQEVMYSASHFVEIDLLRGSRRVPVPRKIGTHEYLVHISRKRLRPRGQLYPLRLPRRLPIIPIPLKAGDPDAQLDLQSLIDQTYDRAGYDMEIDYSQDPVPPLDAEMAAWADELLRLKGLR